MSDRHTLTVPMMPTAMFPYHLRQTDNGWQLTVADIIAKCVPVVGLDPTSGELMLQQREPVGTYCGTSIYVMPSLKPAQALGTRRHSCALNAFRDDPYFEGLPDTEECLARPHMDKINDRWSLIRGNGSVEPVPRHVGGLTMTAP